MSSTSQLTTFSDLYTDLLNRVRVSTGVSATDTQAKRYINIALQDIHLGFDYKLPWCEAQSTLRTKAPYSTGTVSVTNGIQIIIGTGTAWNTNNAFSEKNTIAGGKITFGSSPIIYTVSAVSNDTTIVLTDKFIGDTDLTGTLTYTYFENEYTLNAAFLRPIDFHQFSHPMNIGLIPRNEFRKKVGNRNTPGRPHTACLIDGTVSLADSTPSRKVVLYPYPDQAYHIPYSYITSTVAVTSVGAALTSMSADTDVPIMPLRYRHAIIFHALYHWYRDRKDDSRSDAAKAEYVDIMSRIVGDHDIATHTQAQLQPRNGYSRSAKTPYSYRGGRRVYDLNDEFDSFRR